MDKSIKCNKKNKSISFEHFSILPKFFQLLRLHLLHGFLLHLLHLLQRDRLEGQQLGLAQHHGGHVLLVHQALLGQHLLQLHLVLTPWHPVTAQRQQHHCHCVHFALPPQHPVTVDNNITVTVHTLSTSCNSGQHYKYTHALPYPTPQPWHPVAVVSNITVTVHTLSPHCPQHPVAVGSNIAVIVHTLSLHPLTSCHSGQQHRCDCAHLVPPPLHPTSCHSITVTVLTLPTPHPHQHLVTVGNITVTVFTLPPHHPLPPVILTQWATTTTLNVTVPVYWHNNLGLIQPPLLPTLPLNQKSFWTSIIIIYTPGIVHSF